MKKKYLPPLLIIGYNRPEKIKNLINTIKKIKGLKNIYFKIDGPKNLKDVKKIKDVLLIVNKLKRKENLNINTLIEKKNIGLQKNIINGVDWVFTKEQKLIILEDDNIPTKSFFYFCDKMLSYYKNNKKIMHISGTCFLPKRDQLDDYYFSKFPDIVGWATWKSSWQNNVKSINLKKIITKKILKNYYNIEKADMWFFEYLYREVINNSSKGLWSTWRVLSIIMNKGYSISPKKNLVFHDGYYKKDKPEHYNKKIFYKNTFKLSEMNVAKLQKKKLCYKKKYDKIFFKIIEITDTYFNFISQIRSIIRYILIKINFMKLKTKHFSK